MAGQRMTADSNNDKAVNALPKSTDGYAHEDDILQPVSQALNPDDWPCFVLNGASVTSKDLKTPVSLLHAELEGPLVIRGLLEVDKEFLHLRKDGKTRQKTLIEVTEVRGYSIGIGPVTIWAHGKAGWFEIRPAPTYERMYREMAEGVQLYYFLTDIYEGRKKQALSLDEIFQRYVEEMKAPMTLNQVRQRCEEHAKFLFSQMRKPDEPTRWSRTSFYRWLMERCPQIHSLYQKKSRPTEAHLPEISAVSLDPVTLSKHRRTPTHSEVTTSKKSKTNDPSTEIIVRIMNELHQSRKVKQQQMNILHLSKSLYKQYNIFSETLAQEFIKIHAKSLIAALEGSDWATSPIYLELELILSQPENRKGLSWDDARKLELKPRFDDSKVINVSSGEVSVNTTTYGRGRKRSSSSEQEESVSSVEEDSTTQVSNHGRSRAFRPRRRPINYSLKPRQKTLPSRPKSSKVKYSTSLNGTVHRMDARPKVSEDEDQGESSTVSIGRSLRPRGRKSGKIAALRLVSSPTTKDQYTFVSSEDEEQEGPSRKRPKLSHASNNDSSETTASNDIRSPSISTTDLGDEELEEIKEVLTLVSEPLPQTSPQGPNGLWSCTQNGCDFYAATADQAEGKARVYEHLLKHTDEIIARENLVLEESRPYLQVSHLLEKLRGLGEAARLAEEEKIGDRVVPQPIKRRLMV